MLRRLLFIGFAAAVVCSGDANAEKIAAMICPGQATYTHPRDCRVIA